MRQRGKKLPLTICFVFFAVFLFTFLSGKFQATEKPVSAADLGKFDPGFIISDYQMSNYTSMTEQEIQDFLTRKNSCNNRDRDYYQNLSDQYNGIGYYWYFRDDHFVCLSEERFGDGEVVGEGDTAAHIIWQAAQDYQINPQVLLVLLEKEQSLITDPIPNSINYRSATGYGCPDTAACSTKYYGFKNQIRRAAELYRTVLDGGWTNYPVGQNYIQYNPDAGCGGTVVDIRNLATSALYRYTPYQPNPASLAAGYGTAPCGAYGNRNFYHYFEDWFGGITVNKKWAQMAIPRVMEIKTETAFVDPMKSEIYDEWAKVGEKFYFDTKIDLEWNGKKETCLRLAGDTKNGIDRCLIMSRMDETEGKLYETENIEAKKFKVLEDTFKYDLKTGEEVQEIPLDEYGQISFSAKITYNGKIYFQTTHDFENNNEYFIPAESLEPIIMADFIFPRNMKAKVDTNYVDVETGETCGSVKAGFITRYVSKTTIDTTIYYRTEKDTDEKTACMVRADDVEEIDDWEEVEATTDVVFEDFLIPRELIFTAKSGYSLDVRTGYSCEDYYDVGARKRFTTKITIDDKLYARTETDSEKNSYCVVPWNRLIEV